jgi:hypothetical protein
MYLVGQMDDRFALVFLSGRDPPNHSEVDGAVFVRLNLFRH